MSLLARTAPTEGARGRRGVAEDGEFPAGGEVGAQIQARDWAATSLGATSTWPEALKVPLRLMLASRFEMWLGWGPDLLFFYNDAYAPTLGRKHPWALGRPTREVWSELYADIEGRIRSVMERGEATWDKALPLIMDRGSQPEETHHTFSYSPLRGEAGGVEGLMCVVTEETERVVTERRLGTVQALGEALTETQTIREVWDAAAGALASNRYDFPFALLYEHKNDEWTGIAASDDATRLLRESWPLPVAETAPTIIPLDMPSVSFPCGAWTKPPRAALIVSVRGTTPERPRGALLFGMNPFRLDDPGVEELGSLLADQISGAIARATALVAERRRADRLLAYSRDLAVAHDEDGVWLSLSPSFERVTGVSPDEAIGRNLLEFVHPDDVAATREAMASALVERETTGFENRLVHTSGEARWISWSTAREGNIVYGYGRDVTEAKAQADALAAAEAQLRQSQKMEAVGQLTGGLAHDFNNLLAGISGALELMSTRLSQGRLKDLEKYMTAAMGASRRAAALTHRLLAFSRRQTLDPRPTNINALVTGMEDMIRRTVGPSIAVEVIGASGAWPALVDPPQLENALLNLCINARDAMPDGGRITIETANRWLDLATARQRDIPEGQYLSLCVSDTGTGMPPDVIARAFDPFFTTKPIGEGTGLGLSMIYGFAKQSGGEVRIYSEVGQGTTVCIYLPRHYGDGVVEGIGVGALSYPSTPVAGADTTVLVVDDEPTVRLLITDVLEDLGFTAIEAADSVAGLKVLDSDVRIDLLITDVGLPGGMNGRQMADAGLQRRPDLKVLFITGYAENALLNNGQLRPEMQVLTKPFAVNSLGARVRDLLSKR